MTNLFLEIAGNNDVLAFVKRVFLLSELADV